MSSCFKMSVVLTALSAALSSCSAGSGGSVLQCDVLETAFLGRSWRISARNSDDEN